MKRIDSSSSNYDDLRISTTPRSLKSRSQPIQHAASQPTPPPTPQRDPQIFFDGNGISMTLDWLLAKEKFKLLFTMHRCWDIVINKIHLPNLTNYDEFLRCLERKVFEIVNPLPPLGSSIVPQPLPAFSSSSYLGSQSFHGDEY